MSVSHFTPKELADLTATVTSRVIDTPQARAPKLDHGVGNHRLRFIAMIPAEGDTPSMPDMERGRFCDTCPYVDQGFRRA